MNEDDSRALQVSARKEVRVQGACLSVELVSEPMAFVRLLRRTCWQRLELF
jgi:hypothetical protein